MSARRNRKTDKIDFFVGDKDLRVLPHDTETERRVLAVLLLSTDIFDEYHKYLSPPGMFYGAWEAEIWQIMASLAQYNVPPDLQSVKAHLNSLGRNRDAMELEGMTIEAVTYSTKMRLYCVRLNEYYIRRSVHRMGWHLNTNALSRETDPLELLGSVSDGAAGIMQHLSALSERTNEEAGRGIQDQILQMQKGVRFGLKSSIPDLDGITKGYQNSELTIIAAGTGEGKSTLAFQEIDYQASQGNAIGVILLEMTHEQMLILMACAREKIDVRRVKTENGLTQDELARLFASIEAIKKLPIYVMDKPAMRNSEIKATFRKWKKQHGIKAGYLDHIHLATHDNSELSPEQTFTSIANGLKEISKELAIPIIALAQLARRGMAEKNRKHEKTDLKYAGGIEQAADCILMVYRWEANGITQDKENNSTKGKALIQVAKLRMMEPQDVPVKFTGQRFLDYNDPEAKEPVYLYDNPRAGIGAPPPKIDPDLPF